MGFRAKCLDAPANVRPAATKGRDDTMIKRLDELKISDYSYKKGCSLVSRGGASIKRLDVENKAVQIKKLQQKIQRDKKIPTLPTLSWSAVRDARGPGYITSVD